MPIRSRLVGGSSRLAGITTDGARRVHLFTVGGYDTGSEQGSLPCTS